MSDDEIVKLACSYLKRRQENRLLLINLNHKGEKYNYSDLIVKDLKGRKEYKNFIEINPELKECEKLKILDTAEDMYKIVCNAKNIGYKKTALELTKFNDKIYCEIMKEKALYNSIGLDYIYTNYIEQYIDIVDRIMVVSLFFLVIENPNVTNKLSVLLKIEELVKEDLNIISNDVKLERKRQLDDNKINMERASLYYVQFLYRQAFYYEFENIIDILQKEIDSSQELFGSSINSIKVDTEEYTKKELMEYITEGIYVPAYDKKYKEAERIISLPFESKNLWFSSKKEFNIKVVFRELYMCKKPYLHKNATTIARDILSDIEIDRRYITYLNMKFIRGYFRERNMLKEYKIFNRICTCNKKLLLKVYSTINDREAYININRIGYDFLNLFYETSYSKIEIE
ncbi:MAG: hypothetical protein ACI4VF_00840 [Lachnospirales bacterium]